MADFSTPTPTYLPGQQGYIAPVSPASPYTDPAAVTQAADPAEALYGQLASQAKAAATATQPTPAPADAHAGIRQPTSPAGVPIPQGAVPTAPGTGVDAPPTVTSPGGPSGANSTTGVSPEAQGLLARLAPLGITNLDQLKSKSDVELRKLSGDTVNYENRQQQLGTFFYKNPDGSFDMTRGPDGSPTGLDATGKPGSTAPVGAPPPPAAPGTPPPAPAAPTPATKAKAAVKKPAAKVVTKVTPKAPASNPKPKPAVTPKPAPKPTPKPVPKAVTPAAPRSGAVVAR